MWGLLLFTTMVALSTAALIIPRHAFARNRVVSPYALARDRVPWEEYFDFARNRMDTSALDHGYIGPTILENKVLPYSYDSKAHHIIDEKDMCLFVVDKLIKHMPFLEEGVDEEEKLLMEGSGYGEALLNTDTVDSVTKAKILAGPSAIVEEKVYTEGFPAGHPGIQKPLHHTATIKKAMHVNDAPLFNVPGIQKGRTRLVEMETEKIPVFRLAKLNNMKLALIDVCNEF